MAEQTVEELKVCLEGLQTKLKETTESANEIVLSIDTMKKLIEILTLENEKDWIENPTFFIFGKNIELLSCQYRVESNWLVGTVVGFLDGYDYPYRLLKDDYVMRIRVESSIYKKYLEEALESLPNPIMREMAKLIDELKNCMNCENSYCDRDDGYICQLGSSYVCRRCELGSGKGEDYWKAIGSK